MREKPCLRNAFREDELTAEGPRVGEKEH